MRYNLKKIRIDCLAALLCLRGTFYDIFMLSELCYDPFTAELHGLQCRCLNSFLVQHQQKHGAKMTPVCWQIGKLHTAFIETLSFCLSLWNLHYRNVLKY